LSRISIDPLACAQQTTFTHHIIPSRNISPTYRLTGKREHFTQADTPDAGKSLCRCLNEDDMYPRSGRVPSVVIELGPLEALVSTLRRMTLLMRTAGGLAAGSF
jgi:hypothetical protein